MDGSSAVSLPVINASISYSQEVANEPSITGIGNENIYTGVISGIQGSFSGTLRPDFATYLVDMIESPTQSPKTFIVQDDSGTGFTVIDGYLTVAEISVKVGELVKISCEFVGRDIKREGTVDPASYSDSGPTPYYLVGSSSYSAMSIKIERPYAANIFVLGESSTYGGVSHKPSKYIYQSGDMSIGGSYTLAQRTANPSLASIASMNLVCNGITFTINGMKIITANSITINGRGLVNKTYDWKASSLSLTIT